MLWHCSGCSTAYAVGLPACPHCGSAEYTEEEMPKITVHGGPSNRFETAAGEPVAIVSDAEPTSTVEEPEEAAQPVSDGYDELTKAVLQQELDGRGLSTVGTKAELVERLRENDTQE